MPVNRPKERRVLVATSCTDDEGRLKPTTITLELEGDASILKVKESLASHELLAGVAPERMRLTVYGAEATDEQKLQDVSPTAPDVAARLQIIRRSAAIVPATSTAAEAAGEGASREPPTPRPKATEPDADVGTIDGAPPLETLYLRSAVCGGRPEALHHPPADVKALRELVSKLPLTVKAWHDDPTAAEEGRKPKEVVVKPGDEVPVNQVLLLGQGVDLELEPAEGAAGAPKESEEGGEDGGDGGGEVGGDGGGEVGGDGGGENAAQGSAGDGSADGTGGLVHLRDGRNLHEYGLASGSVLYVVVEGPRPS